MRTLRLGAVLALLVTSIAGAAERRVALVIGNAAYEDAPLVNPVNDARAVADALSRLGFATTKVENADQRALKRAIDAFGDALKAGGVGLFYFSGHGMQIKGRNYLVPVGAALAGESDVEYEGVDAGRVLAKMADAGNPMNLVFLDACRNNPFTRSFRSSSKGAASARSRRCWLVWMTRTRRSAGRRCSRSASSPTRARRRGC